MKEVKSVENNRSHAAIEILGLILMLVGFIVTMILLMVLLGWLGGLLPLGPGLIYLGYQMASATPPGLTGTEREPYREFHVDVDDPDFGIPR